MDRGFKQAWRKHHQHNRSPHLSLFPAGDYYKGLDKYSHTSFCVNVSFHFFGVKTQQCNSRSRGSCMFNVSESIQTAFHGGCAMLLRVLCAMLSRVRLSVTRGLDTPGSSVPRDFPGMNTGVCYHFLFLGQSGVFLTQELNLDLLL